jgi:hypothetical protein
VLEVHPSWAPVAVKRFRELVYSLETIVLWARLPASRSDVAALSDTDPLHDSLAEYVCHDTWRPAMIDDVFHYTLKYHYRWMRNTLRRCASTAHTCPPTLTLALLLTPLTQAIGARSP